MDELSKSYSFREVKVYPPQDTVYFQLFKDGVPTPYIYSEEHLEYCLKVLSKFNSHVG